MAGNGPPDLLDKTTRFVLGSLFGGIFGFAYLGRMFVWENIEGSEAAEVVFTAFLLASAVCGGWLAMRLQGRFWASSAGADSTTLLLYGLAGLALMWIAVHLLHSAHLI